MSIFEKLEVRSNAKALAKFVITTLNEKSENFTKVEYHFDKKKSDDFFQYAQAYLDKHLSNKYFAVCTAEDNSITIVNREPKVKVVW